LKRFRIVLWAFVALVIAGAGSIYMTQQLRDAASRTTGSTRLGAGVVLDSPFTLVTQDGREVTRATFRDKPTAWFFGFTHCPDVCPTSLFHMTKHLKRLGDDAEKLNVVFMSVDPERDTPAVLKEYLSSFDSRIVALTGSPEQVQQAAKGFHAYFAKRPTEGGGYTIDHTSLVMLTARNGEFKGTLDMHEPVEAQFQKLQRLVRGG
jgi:protein SCO1/2